MAKTPTASAAPADPMSDDAGVDDEADAAPDAGADDAGDDDAGSENVLLTVCKEADGTYSLIKGDEEDADGADAAGSADAGAEPEASNKQTFDSKGALLKAILDLLDEDKSPDGGEGSAEDQFTAGFDDGKPATPMAQKY